MAVESAERVVLEIMIQFELHNESQQLDLCSVFQALQKFFLEAFSSLGLDERKG